MNDVDNLKIFIWHMLESTYSVFVNTQTEKLSASVIATKTSDMLLLKTVTQL